MRVRLSVVDPATRLEIVVGLPRAVETDTWSSLAGRVVSHSFVGVPNDDLPLA